MQAIMLAAGKGSRLGKYTKNNTKCMLEVNGVSLLERTIESLICAGINSLTLVVGYKKNELIEYINDKKLNKRITIKYIENNDYNSTNNIYSLYLAKDSLVEDDTILLESDLIYEPSIIKQLVDCKYDNVAVVAKYKDWMDGTVVTIDGDNNIIEFVEKKDFSFNDANNYFKTVNIYKFTKDYMRKFYIPFLETYLNTYGKNHYYELVLKVISKIPDSGIKAMKISNEKWYEIDDCQDLDISSALFATGKTKLELFQKRYGGYWRFSDVKDFCYLVNPYFPTKQFIEKMKFNFSNLICQYPSALYIQNKCISRFCNVDESKIIVGNGAAELINAIGHLLSGTVGVIVPTFNEYIRCFNKNKILELDISKTNYELTKDMVLNFIDEIDNLVLINPDNPTGNFLNKNDIIEIIEKCCKENKKIIFDESFIDFSDEYQRYTLLEDEILDKYSDLIVVKSISKSYGVAGLRLGMLCSSNMDLILALKNIMPIWNINSLAEYFLQNFNIYKNDYIIACNKIADERNRMIKELNKIAYIKAYNSQANYIMCELKQITSDDLAIKLLDQYNILIKSLTGKHGFENKQMIRIAVKSVKENNQLINALMEIGNL